MGKKVKCLLDKEAIIAEYLLGDTTYRKLSEKYGVDFRIIHSWVTRYKGKAVVVNKIKKKSSPNQPDPKEQLPTDVKQLQEELRKARLHNKLLNAMIDIAEDQLKIDIRKKSGTRR
jgi:transposase-like protein